MPALHKKSSVHFVILLAAAAGLYFMGDYFFDLPPSGLIFVSEIVTAIPHGDAVDFECRFTFQSTHPRKTRYQIYFPTHQEGRQGAPEGVTITVDGRPVAAQVGREGFSYVMPVTPMSASVNVIRYTIRSSAHKAVYVTKTANLWPRPLTAARFVLPSGVRSNYHTDRETSVEFKDFRPKENWEVAW